MHAQDSTLARSLALMTIALVASLGCRPTLIVYDDETGPNEGSEESSGSEESGGSAETGEDPAESGDNEDPAESGDSEDSSEGEEPEDEGLTPEDVVEIALVGSELEAMVEGVLAYFEQEQSEAPLHRCPHPDGVLDGESGITPDLGFDCNQGPDGYCVPAVGGGGAGYYDVALWEDNMVWSGAGWMRPVDVPHSFHYNIEMDNAEDGYGACSFTVSAYANFNDDGIYSHFWISGTVDEFGAQVGELMIVDPLE